MTECEHSTETKGEYCERDVFNAECPAPDQLLLITAALYGRMRRGKCVSTRPVGCHVDVHRLLAAKCSARHRCHVSVASLVPDHSQPCHADYRSYLEASYTCIKGNSFISITPYVTVNVTAMQYYCGCPNITLIGQPPFSDKLGRNPWDRPRTEPSRQYVITARVNESSC